MSVKSKKESLSKRRPATVLKVEISSKLSSMKFPFVLLKEKKSMDGFSLKNFSGVMGLQASFLYNAKHLIKFNFP